MKTFYELPEGLTVDGNLDLRDSAITQLPEGLTVGGYLDLRYTPITQLPEGLTVGGGLYLSGTAITQLPEGLTVGGTLDLRNTPITQLPEGLTVGGGLYLSGTPITQLPEGLTVGGNLYLRNTAITKLPQEWFVGGKVYGAMARLRKGRKPLKNGDVKDGHYVYADGILALIRSKRQLGNYTIYVGRFRGQHVVTDGEFFAHCKTLREGIADIEFKKAKARGQEQYAYLSLDTELSVDEAKTMYRVITGACKAGTEAFVSSLGTLKEKYSIREMLELTKGHYGAKTFAAFFAAVS